MRPFGRSICTTCSAGFCTVVLATTMVWTAVLTASFSLDLLSLLSVVEVGDGVEVEAVVVDPDELLAVDELPPLDEVAVGVSVTVTPSAMPGAAL